MAASGAVVELEVVVTGAFLTGVPLSVGLDTYDETQQRLAAAVDVVGGQGWTVSGDRWQREGSYNSGGGFARPLPLVLLRRDGPECLAAAQKLLERRPRAEKAWQRRNLGGLDITVTGARVDIYDLGVAVLAVTLGVGRPADMSGEDLAALVKRLVWLRPDPASGVLPPLAGALADLARESLDQFAAITEEAIPDSVQPSWHPADGPHGLSAGDPDRGRLLWLHPIHIARSKDEPTREHWAEALAPAFHARMPVQDGTFVPGIGWSGLVVKPDSSAEAIPLRLVELHWAYIALYMHLDRGLLTVLDQASRQAPETRIAGLEADADQVFTAYLHVAEARARVESTLAGLGGDEQAIWDTLTRVTRYDALVDGVDRKVTVLQQLTERRVQQATAAQTRRTTTILSFLTALTVVTVSVALITNFLGSRSDRLGHLSIRIAIICLAIAIAVGLYREAFRERPRRRR